MLRINKYRNIEQFLPERAAVLHWMQSSDNHEAVSEFINTRIRRVKNQGARQRLESLSEAEMRAARRHLELASCLMEKGN